MLRYLLLGLITPYISYGADISIGQHYINNLSQSFSIQTNELDANIYQVVYIPYSKTIRFFLNNSKKSKYFVCLNNKHRTLLNNQYQFEFVVKKQTTIINKQICDEFIKEITPK